MIKLVEISFLSALILLMSCKNKVAVSDEISLPKPAVSIMHPIKGNIQDFVVLNGQIVYLNKSEITAPIAGYVSTVKVKLGDVVSKGTLLYSIQTKESKALQNTDLGIADKELGIINVYSTVAGFVSSITVQESGGFVAESSQMLVISKNTDLLIQINAPFQYNQLLKAKQNYEIDLPDGSVLKANYDHEMPLIDPVSQTQKIYLKLSKYQLLPENLNVQIKIPKQIKTNVTLLPKEVILTNETQDNFWIMRVINDSLAVKVNITKGIENNNEVEILTPNLKLTDVIIQQGAYGLPDSTIVKIN